jgi:uncharacterized protein YndB with AHSA1/START domain
MAETTTSTGTVVRDGDAFALRFDREYRWPISEVWSAITTPERAARWLGELRGTRAVGEQLTLVLGESDGEHAALVVEECREPHRLAVSWQFPGTRRTAVQVDLSEAGPHRTRVVLVHSGWAAEEVAGYGCGWQHYVDSLDAYLAGAPLPAFEDYYPATLPEWRQRVTAAR